MASYEDGDDLHAYLRDATLEFCDARLAYWANHETPELLAWADMAARQILRAACDLAIPDPDEQAPDIPWDITKEVGNHEKVRDEVNEAIQLVLVDVLHADLGGQVDRCRLLAERIIARRPSPSVFQYIRRLTRCYLAGFEPECVILCRGVVENAVRDAFVRKRVDLPATPEGKSTMATILDAAVFLRFLSPDRRRDAWTVWTRANKAVHEDLDATADVLGTIMMTVAVLEDIYGAAE